MTSEQEAVPDYLICPITCDIMTDPVVDPEGNTYERSAIMQWLVDNPISPITRNPLHINQLVPNRAIREVLEKFNNKNITNTHTNSIVQPPITSNMIGFPTLSVGTSQSGDHIMITVSPPIDSIRISSSICCVIDVSGSMSDTVTIKNEFGQEESHGLTQLDIVKHAVKTIIGTMNNNDKLSLIAYSDTAKVVLRPTLMNNIGKQQALTLLDNMYASGSTNLWDGVYCGLELLRKNPSLNRALFVLTDGVPTIEPPRGHIPKLQEYVDTNGLSAPIYTFGFGYNLQSELLNDISHMGNGNYAFIPDSSFVGTIFCNALANVLTTMGNNAVLSVVSPNGYQVVGYPHTLVSWGVQIHLGPLNLGQQRNIILKNNTNAQLIEHLQVKLTYQNVETNENKEIYDVFELPVVNNIDEHIARSLVITHITEAMKKSHYIAESQQIIRNLADKIAPFNEIHQDVTGQVTEAFSRGDWYQKWGRHYLPSLINAHLYQRCNNFKDPGVQKYGGNMFKILRNEAEDIFCKLPPPTPTGRVYTNTHTLASMTSYHNVDSGCVHEDCIVDTPNGKRKAKDINKGDIVTTFYQGRYENAIVDCVVRTKCSGNITLIEMSGGLRITPWHPVLCDNAWVFPIDLVDRVGNIKNTVSNCEYVYNFVLNKDHSMIINNVVCVTLGHGFTDNGVITHSYYGTQAVINDLKKLNGWNEGLVTITNTSRNPTNGMVSGIY